MRIYEISDEYTNLMEDDGGTASADIASLPMPFMSSAKPTMIRRIPKDRKNHKRKKNHG